MFPLARALKKQARSSRAFGSRRAKKLRELRPALHAPHALLGELMVGRPWHGRLAPALVAGPSPALEQQQLQPHVRGRLRVLELMGEPGRMHGGDG